MTQNKNKIKNEIELKVGDLVIITKSCFKNVNNGDIGLIVKITEKNTPLFLSSTIEINNTVDDNNKHEHCYFYYHIKMLKTRLSYDFYDDEFISIKKQSKDQIKEQPK